MNNTQLAIRLLRLFYKNDSGQILFSFLEGTPLDQLLNEEEYQVLLRFIKAHKDELEYLQ